MITSIADTVRLSNGNEIPGVGYGTWQITDASQATEGVKAAIRDGYRHIDTAAAYGNEEAVGKGIAEALEENGLTRKDLFITTKLWKEDFLGAVIEDAETSTEDLPGLKEAAVAAFETSLAQLGLDYVDLYLIHWPANAKGYDNWREINAILWSALEEVYRAGKARAIGVSNFLEHHLQALIEDGDVPPMVNQIEYHLGFAQKAAADYAAANGLVVEAWSPLGSGKVLDNEVLGQVADSLGKTPAQVALRWLLQKDIVVLPKSVTPERIASNAELFDFELDAAQMATLDAIEIDGDHMDPDTIDL